MSIDGVSQPTIHLDKYIGKDDTNSVYTIDTKNYTKDTVIKWSIRTAGVTGEYGDWSITREVKVYAQPTVQLTLSNKNNEPITEITSFPIVLECTTQPDTQKLISASVTISSNDTYQTMDNLGNFKMVYVGDVIFNKYYSGTPQTSKDGVEYDDNRTAITLSANNIDFESGHTYTIDHIFQLYVVIFYFTMIVHFAYLPLPSLALHLITTRPFFLPTTVPLVVTVAIFLFEETQITALLFAVAGPTVALSVIFPFLFMVAVFLFNLIDPHLHRAR